MSPTGIEGWHGFAGPPRASGGVGGHLGPPHVLDDETARQRGLLARGGVGVDDALGDRLVERADRLGTAVRSASPPAARAVLTAVRTWERMVRLRTRRFSLVRMRFMADLVFAT